MILPRKIRAKLKELQDLFTKEAIKNHVLPIDDRRSERFDASIAGRPDLMGNRTSLTVYPGMTGMAENAFINVKNRSYTITAPVDLKDANTNGVIIAQAGAFGGWVLYMKDGKVHHEYNYFGVERTNIGGQTALSPGRHEIKYEFIVDAPKPGSGGKCALYVDGQKGGGRADSENSALCLLGRRRHRHRSGQRNDGIQRLQARREQVHWQTRKGDHRYEAFKSKRG